MTEKKPRGANKTSPHDMTVEDFLDRLDSLQDSRYFSEKHAAAMFDLSPKTLQEQRRIYYLLLNNDPANAEAHHAKCIPWVVIGASTIRYRLGDLKSYRNRNIVFGHSQATGPNRSKSKGAGLDTIPYTDGIGIMCRLTDGRIPVAVLNGKILDFIDSSDEDVDAVEMMLPEAAAFISESEFQVVKPNQ